MKLRIMIIEGLRASSHLRYRHFDRSFSHRTSNLCTLRCFHHDALDLQGTKQVQAAVQAAVLSAGGYTITHTFASDGSPCPIGAITRCAMYIEALIMVIVIL
jgi:hypothetical protein